MVTIPAKHSILQVLPKASTRDIVWRFCAYFIFGLTLLCAIWGAITWLEFKRVKSVFEQQDEHDLRLMRFVIGQDLGMLAADLMVLAENESLAQYLENPTAETIEILETRFLNLARDRKHYSQIRLLDYSGEEVVRINTTSNGSEIVPTSQLQNKSNRYYFQDTLGLNPGEVFVSALDLNVENGKIEIPFVPTLRIATPISDVEGIKKGIVILNFKASLILGRFHDALPGRADSTFELLNGEGYWLKAENPNSEWGFMFQNNVTLKREKPSLWNAIESRQEGQVAGPDGIYTYTRLYPRHEIRRRIGNRESINGTYSLLKGHEQKIEELRVWYLVLFTPSHQRSFFSFLQRRSPQVLILPLFLLMIAAATLHLAIIHANKVKTDRTLKMLSTGVEQSPAAVVITDSEGSIKYANPKFEKMTGYSKEEIAGENPRMFKSGKTPDTTYRELWQAIRGGEVWVGDFENKRKDETPYYVSAKIAPVYMEAGEIGHFMAVMEDVTENRKLQDQLEKMALYDGLTGVLNRMSFLEKFTKEAVRARRYGGSLSILAFDLDRFKRINDTFGHHVGDQVLTTFTATVESELRGSDFLGRLGGEEFCALLVETGYEGALRFAERLRKAVEGTDVICGEHVVRVTVSVGVAEWQGTDEEIKEVLIRADRALYKAKHAGRNQVKYCPE